MFGGSSLFFADNSKRGALGNLMQIPGLTFFKDFARSNATLNADYSLGSPTATFTATRSASAPATYVDSNGVIQLTTTSNVGRNQGGYYNTSGFTAQKGLMIEAAGTNLLVRTDGTAASGGQWTGWNDNSDITGTATKSNPSITDLTSIAGATSQRAQYTGIVTDTGKTIQFTSTKTAVGSFLQNTKVTGTFYIRSRTGNTGVSIVKINIYEYSAVGAYLTEGNSSGFTVGSSWTKISYTYTATNVLSSQSALAIFVGGIDNGDIVDFEIYGAQLEVNPYATSFIPTTTASLTRGAEVLTYPISNNRTAASESIFIKFAPAYTFTSSYNNNLLDSDTKRRNITSAGSTNIYSFPNRTDNGTVIAVGTTTPSINTPYVSASVYQHLSPYATIYGNATSENSYTAGDYTTPTWGTNFYIGSSNSGNAQINSIIQSVAFYNTALSASQVNSVTKFLS